MSRPKKISLFSFKPSIFQALRGYNKDRFVKDVTAGLTVGVVALPLGMAFAIASGLPPQTGIFTAIIAGFLIAMLGGCKVQIGGPAGAFIVIVYGIVQRYGVSNLIIATAMSGVLLFAMGARLIPSALAALLGYGGCCPAPVAAGAGSPLPAAAAGSRLRASGARYEGSAAARLRRH